MLRRKLCETWKASYLTKASLVWCFVVTLSLLVCWVFSTSLVWCIVASKLDCVCGSLLLSWVVFNLFIKDSEDGVMRLTASGTCGVGCEGLEFQALGYTAGH